MHVSIPWSPCLPASLLLGSPVVSVSLCLSQPVTLPPHLSAPNLSLMSWGQGLGLRQMGVGVVVRGTGLGRFQECGRARLAETCPAWRQSPLPAPRLLCLFGRAGKGCGVSPQNRTG